MSTIQAKVNLPGNYKQPDGPILFEKADDGWYENEEFKLAIDPDFKVCIASPWYADHIASAPTFDFDIIKE